MGWWWGGGRILPFLKKRGENFVFFFLFLFNVYSYYGERLFFFQYKRANKRARKSKIDPKIDTFWQVGIRDLAILGVEKIVFWTFSKLFVSSIRHFFGLKKPTVQEK